LPAPSKPNSRRRTEGIFDKQTDVSDSDSLSCLVLGISNLSDLVVVLRKKSKYKPRGVRLDAVNWVLAGLKPIAEVGDALITLKAKNHSALTEVVQGRGNRDQIDVLIAALNMCEAYAIHGFGEDWKQEIKEGQDALYSMAKRGLDKGKFLFTGPEMQAVNLAMDIHDAQLEVSSVAMMEKMIDFVTKQITLKKARPIT
jgi:hypothetical protein